MPHHVTGDRKAVTTLTLFSWATLLTAELLSLCLASALHARLYRTDAVDGDLHTRLTHCSERLPVPYGMLIIGPDYLAAKRGGCRDRHRPVLFGRRSTAYRDHDQRLTFGADEPISRNMPAS